MRLISIEKDWKHVLMQKMVTLNTCCQGRSQGVGGSGGPGTPPNPIPLKLLRIKRVRTRHALRIRLIELWMSWMNWELRSINCYELVGYFGLQLACVSWECSLMHPRLHTVLLVRLPGLLPSRRRVSASAARGSRQSVVGSRHVAVIRTRRRLACSLQWATTGDRCRSSRYLRISMLRLYCE